jgi:flavin-dependent dehydrogenase
VRDLVVAGGGPVGMAVALHAQRAGLDVVVREPRTGPINKACGEGLTPGAVAELASLGVTPRGHDIAGIRYLDAAGAGSGVSARFTSGPGRGVRRTVLHAALAEQLAAAGVAVEPSAVRQVRQGADHVEVDGERARYLVAADGLHSPTRRLLGLEAGAPAGRRRFGLRCHVQQEPWSSFVEVYWSPRAEAYVTPVDDGLVGVAVLTDTGQDFDDALAAFPLLRERLVGTRTRVRGAGPLRQRVRARALGRVLLVGDAAGYVDALTGEGIALGLAQARAAVACLAAGAPERYEQQSRRIGRRQEVLTHALLAATGRPTVRRLLVPAAERLPWVFSTAVNQLARPIEVPA